MVVGRAGPAASDSRPGCGGGACGSADPGVGLPAGRAVLGLLVAGRAAWVAGAPWSARLSGSGARLRGQIGSPGRRDRRGRRPPGTTRDKVLLTHLQRNVPAGATGRMATEESGMKISDAKVIVTCPGRNFVTLKIVTETGVTGVGDATLNGRELAVASYLTDHVVPLLIGRDPADRGHLAVPLQGRLLAARPGHDDARSPPWTPRCGTSRARSPGCRSTSCSAARSREGVTGLRPRQRRRPSTRRWPRSARYLDLGYRAIRVQTGDPRPGHHLRGRQGQRCSTSRPTPRPADRGRSGPPSATSLRPAAVRPGARGVRPRLAAAARRAPPAHPDRGGAAGQGAGAVRADLDGGPGAGRAAGGLPADPRSTPPPRSRWARCSTRSGTASSSSPSSSSTTSAPPSCTPAASPTCGASSTSPRCTTCAPARTAPPTSPRSAWPPPCTSTSRIPNFGLQEYMRHTAGDRRGLPARLPLRGRLPAPVRGARARRGHRRGTGRAVPVPAGVPAGEPPRRRHAAQLVTVRRREGGDSVGAGPRYRGPAPTGRRLLQPGQPLHQLGSLPSTLPRPSVSPAPTRASTTSRPA